MQHCTVCGAASREGAKFCTSCGARLEDSSISTDAADAASNDAEDTTPETAPADRPATWPAPIDDGASAAEDDPEMDTADDDDIDPSKPLEPGDRQTFLPRSYDETLVSETPSHSDGYAANWPSTADDASEETTAFGDSDESDAVTSEVSAGFTDDATQDPDRSDDETSGWIWGSADDEPSTGVSNDATGRGPESAETDMDEQDDSLAEEPLRWTWASADDQADNEAPVSFAIDADQGQESVTFTDEGVDDLHGASDWESWAPESSGEGMVESGDEESLTAVRDLVDDLKQRIDRLASPASMQSRDLDPDDLADQLERWSEAVQGTDDLLDIMQDVRTSPRDLDAITRLADRAADLEVLMRHYQSITSLSEQWVYKLRRERSNATGE